MKMPAYTSRAHFTPPWRGDRLSAVRKVGTRRLGRDRIRAMDTNYQWFWNDLRDHSRGGEAYCCHWGMAGRDNYKYLHLNDGQVRRMTKAELARPAHEWSASQVHHWRRRESVHSERPQTMAEMFTAAAAHGVTIIPELKSPAFAQPKVAAHVVKAAEAAEVEPWFMALLNMRNCRGKCEAIINAGGQFAIIFGRNRFQRKPKDWAQWDPKPTRIWGPKRARKWLKEGKQRG